MKTARPLVRTFRQRGQAMVEFIVATLFFLLPLYLIIVALGKFADVQATTTQAARYVAWERTVYSSDTAWKTKMGSTAISKTTAELKSEIAQRILGENRTALRAVDRSQNSLSNGTLKTWTDPAGNALLQRYQDVAVTENGHTLSMTECPTCTVPTALPFPTPFNLGINVPQNNMVVANVGLSVGGTSAALKRLFPSYTGWNGVNTQAKVALLPNEWNANGRDAVTAVVKDAVPTANNPLKTALEASVKAPMAAFAMEIIPLKVGDIRPDEVPADRLR